MNRQLATTNTKVIVGLVIAVAIIVGIFAVVRLDVTGKTGSGLGSEFVYDIEGVGQIDPNLILYEQALLPIETGFSNAYAVAVDSEGSIYVAGDSSIRVFTENGDSFGEIELAGTPRCLALAADGSIYVGMRSRVEHYNAQSERLASWPDLGGKAVLASIAVSKKGEVFVADAGNRIVLRYDTEGRLLGAIGAKDTDRNIPGFVIPSPYFDLAMAEDGLLRVVNPGMHRIEAYTPNGDLEFSWGRFGMAVDGFCGCCNPVNFAILEDGSFVTCEKGLKRVKIYDPEGSFVGVVAGPEQLGHTGPLKICMLPTDCQAGGFDVAVDPSGRILVLDTVRNVVRVFTRIKKEL
ncbi:MAG: NHL repeat-containing protein [Phycisphaerales bacterium]|nr:MAG: NHL repeat-containing protein [Phycisphaerales bacterium]